MISVHSSGHPSTKISAWVSIRNCNGVRFMPISHFSISSCPPCKAKTAENSPEPTNNQQTIAVVLAVR